MQLPVTSWRAEYYSLIVLFSLEKQVENYARYNYKSRAQWTSYKTLMLKMLFQEGLYMVKRLTNHSLIVSLGWESESLPVAWIRSKPHVSSSERSSARSVIKVGLWKSDLSPFLFKVQDVEV